MNQTNPTPSHQLLSTKELLDTQGPAWLVPNLIPRGGLVCLFGAPGASKTTVAIDLAVALAARQPFLDHPTQQCGVLYCNLEGHISHRVRAAFAERSLDAQSTETHLSWCIDPSIDLCTDEGRDSLKSCVQNFQRSIPNGLSVVVILDNLARAMHGADENNMVGLGTALSTLEYACHNATVILIHHSGHKGERPRGHSALMGAADTMIRISPEKSHRLLTVEKQRDASDDRQPNPFVLLPVRIPGQGAETTACVIKTFTHPPQTNADRPTVKEAREPAGVAGLVLEILAPLSRGNPVLEKVAREAVIDKTLDCDNTITREAAAKRFVRGRDALAKIGRLVRDEATQSLTVPI